MEPTKNDVAYEFLPYFRAYKVVRVERFFGTDRVPASTDSKTGVSSKDILISRETRHINPPLQNHHHQPTTSKAPPSRLLPRRSLLLWLSSPFSATYHNHLISVVAKLILAYEDSWAALKWVASHFDGQGPEPWINDYADLDRVFVAGDSAGGNIAHNMAVQAGVEDLEGIKLLGACVVHPGFCSIQTP
ncbi:hypothetical protein ACSBR1_019839 [Camellia fascicularis]